jgi:hypothetical protein
MAEPILNASRVVPSIGQGVAAGMAQHVRMNGKGEPGARADALDQAVDGWRAIGDDALLEKPADDCGPKRIDCYQVVEHSATGAAFRLDPARLIYSPRWKHNAHPTDFEMVLVQNEPTGWVNTANLVLLGELRRRAPEAIDWAAMGDVIPVLDAFEAARRLGGLTAGLSRPRGAGSSRERTRGH